MMEKEVLSLKSIYKFLTINDYPVYSEGIIKKNNRSGLTLTKFCHNNVIVDFKNRKTGKIIWRMQGGRNRYVSEICNRSRRIQFYREYAEEIAEAVNEETVLRQIRQFMFFLKERHYNCEVFYQKMPAYINQFADSDEAFTEKALEFFLDGLQWKEKLEQNGAMAKHFLCGWFLTFLMFHALMGNGEGERYLSKLREDASLGMENLFALLLKEEEGKRAEVVYLTNRNTELNSSPLGAGHFFGREEELFELREMLSHGGKYLISGIGGVGKTELMRQFLRCCVEERLTDYICVVQYEGSLAQSLVRSFPQIQGADLNKNYREALARIREHAGEKILIAIDNVDGGIKEEELDELRRLPATIFMTSRYQKIKGLRTYNLKTIGRESGKLIFRDNYGSRLSEEERKILDTIVDREVWCHTLTLRLLAKTAKNCGWTLGKLKEQLERYQVPVGFSELGQYEDLKQVYNGMYAMAGLSEQLKSFLRVFAVFPYQSYDYTLIEKYMHNLLEENIEDSLNQLWVGGWLEKQGQSYSMHPFIAECILSVPITEEECMPFFENVIGAWRGSKEGFSVECLLNMIYDWDGVSGAVDGKLMEATGLTKAFVGKLSGGISEQTLLLFMMAAMIEYNHFGASKAGLGVIERLYKKRRKPAEEVRVALNILLCYYGHENMDMLWEEWQSIRERSDISQRCKYAFADVLSVWLYNTGHFAGAEEVVECILEYCQDDYIRISAYAMYSSLMVQKGDFIAHGEWLQKGIELGRQIGREKSQIMQQLLMNMCSLKIALGKYDEAETALRQLEEVSTDNMYYINCQIQFYRGSLAMHRGDEGYGVASLEKACEYAGKLFCGTGERNYCVSLVELAMAYSKAKRYEKSEKCYKEALAIYSAMDETVFDRHRILNNMSVMYLEANQPENAIKYLTEALLLAETLGGLAFGENLNNLSKAWRAVGDREKELEYLEKGLPILEQFYGSEHPKVGDARRRLQEA